MSGTVQTFGTTTEATISGSATKPSTHAARIWSSSYDDSVVVVEAKTKTVEHAAPSGRAQTFAYRDSVMAHLGPEHAWKLVYRRPMRCARRMRC